MTLGKSVKPDQNWLRNKGIEIMRKGVRAKFSLEEMKDYLLATTGVIGEATRHPHWGIGHTLSANEAKSIANWEGSNALGELLTEMRDEFAEEL